MSRKSEATKEHIRKTARKVFARKGFKDVTMKDIAEAGEISRGGLYLYYKSTEEILEVLLREDANAQDSVILQAVRERKSADQILLLFLEEQKKELMGEDDGLYVATYEYGFLHHQQFPEKQQAFQTDMQAPEDSFDGSFLTDKFHEAVRVIEYLIRLGIHQKVFTCSDAHAQAQNMMFAIEGMKVLSRTVALEEKEIDTEINLLMDRLY